MTYKTSRIPAYPRQNNKRHKNAETKTEQIEALYIFGGQCFRCASHHGIAWHGGNGGIGTAVQSHHRGFCLYFRVAVDDRTITASDSKHRANRIAHAKRTTKMSGPPRIRFARNDRGRFYHTCTIRTHHMDDGPFFLSKPN